MIVSCTIDLLNRADRRPCILDHTDKYKSGDLVEVGGTVKKPRASRTA